jgi:hypothetical protein
MELISENFPAHFKDFNKWLEGFKTIAALTNYSAEHFITDLGGSLDLDYAIRYVYDMGQLEELNDILSHKYGVIIIKRENQFVIGAIRPTINKPKNI